MNDADAYHAYLNLAEDLFVNRITKRDVTRLVLQLPPLTVTLLKKLGGRAEETASRQPRRSWAIARVSYSASTAQDLESYIQSLAAWYLGRASNHWGQPELVKSMILRARRGFLKLNEMGWVAACDWQFYALSWTRPDIPKAVTTLQRALAELQQTGFDEFVPHCRAALAYAQLLTGKFNDARDNIRICEALFIEDGDFLNRARCWLNEASLHRREGRVEDALRKLSNASAAFKDEKAPVDLAKAHYQIGLCHLMMADDLPKAIDQLNKASEMFSAFDMDLWEATCINNLGYAYLLLGSLETADKCYQQARKIFVRHKVLAPLADNLNDNGKLNTHRGYLNRSIEQFKEAEKLHEELGMKLPAAVDAANLGEAYGLAGRYQDALHHLERATERFKAMNNLHRLESSEKFMALIWSKLGQFEDALYHLDRATAYHEKDDQKSSASSIYTYRASILFMQKEYVKSVDYLKLALEATIIDGLRPQTALIKRMLGEALLYIQQDTEALNYLKQANSDFTDIGMMMDQAFTLVALGTHYAQISKTSEALQVFEEALQLSQGSMPEIEWRAHAGLALLAALRGDAQAEISAYRRAMLALKEISQNFWQPALAGSYLHTPSDVFERAIQRATEMKANEDALQFVEQHKATTLLEQLKMSDAFIGNRKTKKLAGIRSEIIWLQNKSRMSFEANKGIKSTLESRQLRSQILEKVRLYDSELARIERRNHSKESPVLPSSNFNLAEFRNIANDSFGESWAALDFYLTDNNLITIAITPDQYLAQNSPITNRISMALEMVSLSRQHAGLSQSDLKVLGDFLFPTSLANILAPETYLLLAPHRKLHGVPWAAIEPSSISKPLVSRCIPVVVPSLYTFCLLWKRAELDQSQTNRYSGLMIGLSTFKGLHRDLPQVKEEASILATRLGAQGKFLIESEATWGNLANFLANKKRNRKEILQTNFDWLHVASHFFVDSHTGRTSGIVLWDGDVWLDQLRDLAPLPQLVTFSTCNSIFSFVYEGDEHMDLPSTCFIAGAGRVVGSSRRILDSAATEFTESFYEYYLHGLGPAKAVALTQRRMIEQSKDIENWSSFVCMGIP